MAAKKKKKTPKKKATKKKATKKKASKKKAPAKKKTSKKAAGGTAKAGSKKAKKKTAKKDLAWKEPAASSLHEGAVADEALPEFPIRKRLYGFTLLGGMAAAVFIYAILDPSQDDMVLLSPLWVLAVGFGLIGLLAEKAVKRVRAGLAEDMTEAVGLKPTDIHFPILYYFKRILCAGFTAVKIEDPLHVAAKGTLIWGVLLYGFFLFVFPKL